MELNPVYLSHLGFSIFIKILFLPLDIQIICRVLCLRKGSLLSLSLTGIRKNKKGKKNFDRLSLDQVVKQPTVCQWRSVMFAERFFRDQMYWYFLPVDYSC